MVHNKLPLLLWQGHVKYRNTFWIFLKFLKWFYRSWRTKNMAYLRTEKKNLNSLGVVGLRALHHPYPGAFWTIPSFTRIKKTRWRPDKLNDRYLRFHGETGDCEQSTDYSTPLYLLITFKNGKKKTKNNNGDQLNRPRSIYQYSNMAPRLSGQNCKFVFFLPVPKRDLHTKKTTPTGLRLWASYLNRV